MVFLRDVDWVPEGRKQKAESRRQKAFHRRGAENAEARRGSHLLFDFFNFIDFSLSDFASLRSLRLCGEGCCCTIQVT
jgi:hypothetical protein